MSYKLRKMREGITDDQPNTPTVFNEKQADTIGKLGGKEKPISWAEAHGMEEVHFNEAGQEVKGPRPGKFKPITIGPFTIDTKSTLKLSTLNTSKGNKSKRKESEEFKQESFSREQASKEFPENDPGNVSTLKLSTKKKHKKDKKGGVSFFTNLTKEKEKFKGIENNELMKHVGKSGSKLVGFSLGNREFSTSIGRSSFREEVRPITPAAAKRKGDRWERRQERKKRKNK